MNKILFLFIIFLFTQVSFSQIKFDEYAREASDAESIRIENLLIRLREKPDDRALIIVYSGEAEQRIGDVLRHIDGINAYVSRFGDEANEKIRYQIKEGKSRLFKEFWLYPKDVALPVIELPALELPNLQENYLVGQDCVGCDPAVYTLSSGFGVFTQFAELLRKYPSYKGLIIISQINARGWSRRESYRRALKFVIDFRNQLTLDYKIDKKRVRIQIANKQPPSDNADSAKFYILPAN